MSKKSKSLAKELTPKIVVEASSRYMESYNRLKDNIIYSSDNGRKKVFQVESAVSGEGKSSVVANTAVLLAKSGKKVVVVDLDFRRPKMHMIFDMPNINGIAEYMLDECAKEDLVKTTKYGVYVVNRGKSIHNASIVFTSEKFKNLIEELKKEFDFVLFDCPPVLLVSDYIHYSVLADETIFIASVGVTRRSQLMEACELMRKCNPNILGIVITHKNQGNKAYKYGSNYYYKGYYGSRKYLEGSDNDWYSLTFTAFYWWRKRFFRKIRLSYKKSSWWRG